MEAAILDSPQRCIRKLQKLLILQIQHETFYYWLPRIARCLLNATDDRRCLTSSTDEEFRLPSQREGVSIFFPQMALQADGSMEKDGVVLRALAI